MGEVSSQLSRDGNGNSVYLYTFAAIWWWGWWGYITYEACHIRHNDPDGSFLKHKIKIGKETGCKSLGGLPVGGCADKYYSVWGGNNCHPKFPEARGSVCVLTRRSFRVKELGNL